MAQNTKQQIIEETLALIDETQDIREVKLRKIARRVGIAHTSIYNYFASLEDLYLKCIEVAIIKGAAYVRQELQANKADYLYTFFAAQLDFALEHPGWYKFIWIENVADKTTEVYQNNIQQPRDEFIEFMFLNQANQISKEDKYWIVDLVHGYFHGDLVKLISGRMHIEDQEQAKDYILENTLQLYETLIKKVIK